MKWLRNLKISTRALNRARARTLLSASSMTIGIAAMFMLLSLAAGSERAFEQALESMGRNLLAVGSVRKESDALRGKGRRYQTLTMGDWQAIGSEVSETIALVHTISSDKSKGVFPSLVSDLDSAVSHCKTGIYVGQALEDHESP